MKKKVFCLFLVASLMTGSIAVNAANFYDIGDAPWAGAATYINRVADLGIMVGSDDVKGRKVFKPKANVTYSETAQLAYSLLKTTGQLVSGTNYKTQYSAIMNSNKIPTWAQEAVGYCLGQGFITIADVSKFTDNKGKDVNATREDVAKMFGKAMKDFSASGSTSVFKDATSISADALTQVNHLSALGILTGDSNGNFNPKNAINRSEMAVLVTKAYDVVNTKGGAKTGIITALEDFGTSVFITVGIGGSSKGFYLSENVIVTKGITALTTKDLGIYDTIEIDFEGATVNSIKITDDFQVDSPSTSDKDDEDKDEYERKGTMTKITSSIIELDDDDEYDIDDVDDLTIEIDGKSKDIDDLKEAFSDYDEIEVVITLDKCDYVIEIIATTEDDDDYDEKGILTDISSSSIELDDDDEYEIDDVDDLTIKIDNKTKDFDDLEDAFDDYDEVEVKITLDRDDYVTKIIATTDDDDSNDDDEVTGEIAEFDSDDEIKIGRNWYDLANSVDVDVEDGSENDAIEDIDDLIEAFEDDDKKMDVTIVIEDDEVTEITGEVIEILDCDLSQVLTNSEEIRVECSSGSYEYKVDDDCEIEIDSDDGYSLDGLDTAYRDDDIVITEMILDNGIVVEIVAETN